MDLPLAFNIKPGVWPLWWHRGLYAATPVMVVLLPVQLWLQLMLLLAWGVLLGLWGWPRLQRDDPQRVVAAQLRNLQQWQLELVSGEQQQAQLLSSQVFATLIVLHFSIAGCRRPRVLLLGRRQIPATTHRRLRAWLRLARTLPAGNTQV